MPFQMPRSRTSGARAVSVPQVRGIGGDNPAATQQVTEAVRQFAMQKNARRLEEKQDEAVKKAGEKDESDRLAAAKYIFESGMKKEELGRKQKFEAAKQMAQQQGQSREVSRETMNAGAQQNPYADLPMPALQEILKGQQKAPPRDYMAEAQYKAEQDRGAEQQKTGRAIVLQQMKQSAEAGRGGGIPGSLRAEMMSVSNPEVASALDRQATRRADAMASKFKALFASKESAQISSENRKLGDKLNSAEAIIDQISELSKKINTFGPIGRVLGAPSREASNRLELNEDYRLLESKKGMLGQIVRLLGDRGALSEGDVKRGMELVPGIHSTAAVAKGLIGELKGILNRGWVNIGKRSAMRAFGEKSGDSPMSSDEVVILGIERID